MCHSCMPRRVRVRCWGYLVAGKCILRSLVWLTMRFTPGSNACVVRPAEMQSPGAETLNHQPAQMHASPYARNLANARALESGLLWLMLTAICLRFLIYGLLPFTLSRDRAAAATLRPGSRVGAAVADLDAAAGAPEIRRTRRATQGRQRTLGLNSGRQLSLRLQRPAVAGWGQGWTRGRVRAAGERGHASRALTRPGGLLSARDAGLLVKGPGQPRSWSPVGARTKAGYWVRALHQRRAVCTAGVAAPF